MNHQLVLPPGGSCQSHLLRTANLRRHNIGARTPLRVNRKERITAQRQTPRRTSPQHPAPPTDPPNGYAEAPVPATTAQGELKEKPPFAVSAEPPAVDGSATDSNAGDSASRHATNKNSVKDEPTTDLGAAFAATPADSAARPPHTPRTFRCLCALRKLAQATPWTPRRPSPQEPSSTEKKLRRRPPPHAKGIEWKPTPPTGAQLPCRCYQCWDCPVETLPSKTLSVHATDSVEHHRGVALTCSAVSALVASCLVATLS